MHGRFATPANRVACDTGSSGPRGGCLAHIADETVTLTIPITKSYRDADGNLYVEGIATDDSLDLDHQIIDKDFSRRELPKWFAEWGNVRQMHSPNLAPAGKAVEFREVPEGFFVKTLVVEPTAQKLVEERVYQAYSVGIAKPRIVADNVAKNGRVVDGVFTEISLVDFPANPHAKFQLAKRASSGIEIVEKAVDPDLTKLFHKDEPRDDHGKWSSAGAILSAAGHTIEIQGDHHEDGPNHVRAHDVDSGWTGPVRNHREHAERDAQEHADELRGVKKEAPSPADVAKAVGGGVTPEQVKARAAAEWYALTKRDMDPNVGGGVDRDKIPGEDFAGPHRSFPIVTPGDVSDAAHLVGHADDPEAVKQRISEIAHRKGKAFVDQLPDSMKGDAAKAEDAEVTKAKDAEEGLAEHPEPDGDEDGPDVDGDGDGKAEKARRERAEGEKKPFPGAAKPFAKDGEKDDEDEDDKAEKLAYHLARLHDATCAAFRAEDVLEAHPAVAKGVPAVVDVSGFAAAVSKALTEDAGTGSRIADIPELSEAYGLAVQLKAADPELIERVLADVRKAFAEMYPDAHPRPTDIQPGQFKRSYVSAGRASLSSNGKAPRIPLASHVPSPKSGEPELVKGETFYTQAAKEHATEVLIAMHDSIAKGHPMVCPMDGMAAHESLSGSSVAPALAAHETIDTRATNTPTPVSAEQAAANVTKAFDPEKIQEFISKAVEAATKPLNEELATLRKSVDEMSSQPDPGAQAYRGSALLGKAMGQPQTPAGRSDDDPEAAAQVEEIVRMVKRARHPDSEVSVPAMNKLIERFGPDAANLLG